jgi:hypothetical protein
MQKLTISFRLFLLSFCVISFSSYGQYAYQTADLAVSGGGGGSSLALSYTKMFAVGKKQAFRIGYGLRLTSATASNQDYITAPANLTAGKSSLAAFFEPKKIETQLDTLRFGSANTNAVNLSINLQYELSKKLEVGFNIDAIGVTLGGRKSGTVIAKQSDAQGKANNGKTITAVPTAFNLLLISDSDIGSLNSELYARYWVSKKIGIRAGASFQFSEFKSDSKVAFDNDRFRAKTLMPFVGISVKF